VIAEGAGPTALAPSNPIARLTSTVFGLVPAWLPLLVLRLALARPFFASGLTRWDGWFALSASATTLFADEYKLHVFGAEIPFPMPEFVATMASAAEIVLPILLALGLLTRWAALGLLLMTGVIQLTYPEAGRIFICIGLRLRLRSQPSAPARFRSTASSPSTAGARAWVTSRSTRPFVAALRRPWGDGRSPGEHSRPSFAPK
jgi:putative oxidoreductase